MFHNVLFPEAISYGSKGGPKFSTSIITLASGKERRNINWIRARAEYDVSHGIKDREQMEEIREFFYARRGRAHSFRFKDWGDYTAESQIIGVGDGTTKAFQLVKTYQNNSYSYVRTLTKPVSGTLLGVKVDGVAVDEDDYTIDYNTGIITFDEAPAADANVEYSSVEFHVHCRFDTDHFDPSHDFWMTESWESIPIVEIKD